MWDLVLSTLGLEAKHEVGKPTGNWGLPEPPRASMAAEQRDMPKSRQGPRPTACASCAGEQAGRPLSKAAGEPIRIIL